MAGPRVRSSGPRKSPRCATRPLAGRVGGPRGFRQWNKRDLEELCVACGLVDFECDVRDGFIFYAAKKPVAFTGTDA